MQITDWLKRFPPYLVRALARDRRKKQAPLTTQQMVDRIGGRRTTQWIDRLSNLASWQDLQLREILDFFEATGFELGRWNREREYLIRTISRQKRPASHIERLPKAQKEFVMNLLATHKAELSQILIDFNNK